MSRIGFSFYVLLAILFVSTGCTIKEDREPCPCWLFEDLSECYGSDSPLYLSAWKGGRIYLEAIEARLFPAGFEKKVPRDQIEVSAYQGCSKTFLDGHRLMIPVGNEADSIFAYRNIVDATGEKAYDLVELHKQFATVTMDLENYREDNPYELKIEGNVCGMDILDLSPVEGSFICVPRFVRNGRSSFRVPRQTDGSLILKIVEDGLVKRVFNIGEMILSSGYSWDEADLDDIYIDVDYERCTMSISVMNWEEGKKDIYNY